MGSTKPVQLASAKHSQIKPAWCQVLPAFGISQRENSKTVMDVIFSRFSNERKKIKALFRILTSKPMSPEKLITASRPWSHQQANGCLLWQSMLHIQKIFPPKIITRFHRRFYQIDVMSPKMKNITNSYLKTVRCRWRHTGVQVLMLRKNNWVQAYPGHCSCRGWLPHLLFTAV